MENERGRKRPAIRRQGRYGEQTVLRRVPMSVVPLLDFLLEQMARAAQNDPRKTLERVARAVDKLADEEQERDDSRDRKSRNLRNRQDLLNNAITDVLSSQSDLTTDNQ